MREPPFGLDAHEIDGLQKLIVEYGNNASKIINEIIHDEGEEEIENQIMKLLPASGRSWKGKKKAARFVEPFKHKDEMLTVTIHTVKDYHYLYFPDDGTNTLRHAGNQGFMLRGGMNATPKIIDLCLKKLTENF